MLKKLTALTAAMATAATMAMAEETPITQANVNAEAGSADTCVLDSIGNFSGGATAAVPVASVAACFALTEKLSHNIPQRQGWRKTQGTAMKGGEIVDNFACRDRSEVKSEWQRGCFRPDF